MSLLRPTPLKLGIYYATLFVGSGAGTAFISVWFRSHGLSGSAIGVILALPMLARLVTGPAMAIWADGFEYRRTALVLMGALSTLGYGLLLVTHGFLAWAAAWFVGVTAYWVCSPLADVVTLRAGAREGFPYALPRGVGSAAYVVANITSGSLIPIVGPGIVVWWITAAAAASTVGGRLLIPPERVNDGSDRQSLGDRLSAAGALFRNRPFVLMLAAVSLIQSAHAFFYAFSALVWRAQGIAPGWSGALWGFGVAVEVCFLWWGEPLRRRLGARRLLAAGALGSLIRWGGFALSPPLWVLFPLQGLHALSFTATFVASLELTQELCPREAASTAQSLNAGLSFGLATGLATLAAGPLYDRFGALGYLAMAALAGAGLIAALPLVRGDPAKFGPISP